LENNVSFNFFVAHGGTNFGFTSGANYDKEHDIQPDITSYDYDAPISEAGWATAKYTAIRNKLKEYVTYNIPEPPPALPVIEIPSVKLTKAISLFDFSGKIEPVINDTPLSFEDLNQGFGYVLYEKNFTDSISGNLEVKGLRDYALVYVNDKKVGELNRNVNKYSMDIQIPAKATLKILVENMGRINYGAEIVHNTKGIISPVKINGMEITGNWKMYKLPMNEAPRLNTFTGSAIAGAPAIYRGSFNLIKTGDTFLDMSKWGKGIVFINGINIGRYWNVGPQQTLYTPGCWLKKGKNEIVIFEQQNDRLQTEVSTIKMPVFSF
jgi:beta-galactosidase